MCEAWEMENKHGYSIKDIFQAGFIQGANWRRKQSPWINVKDRLPEEDTDVFFAVKWGALHYNYFVGLYEGNGIWQSDNRMLMPNSIGKVTHWMYIPEIEKL